MGLQMQMAPIWPRSRAHGERAGSPAGVEERGWSGGACLVSKATHYEWHGENVNEAKKMRLSGEISGGGKKARAR